MLNKELLAILACPRCKGEVKLLMSQDGLHCKDCMVVYPVEDNIPIMLVSEGIKKEDWQESWKKELEL